VGHEDGPQGLVLAVQDSRRLQEEVLTGGVIHGGPRGSVTGFSVRRNRGLVRLLVRGVEKVKAVALWFAIAHNVVCGGRLRAEAAATG